MIPLSAAEIAAATGGRILAGDPERSAERVVIDSRQVREGDAFVAIVGPRDNGHRYLQQALAAGATVLVVQRDDLHDQLVNPRDAAVIHVDDTTEALQRLGRHLLDLVDPVVIGITGSVGKTTTKALTWELLRTTRSTHVTPGNFNNHWGLPLSLLGLEPHHEWMVAEMGMSYAGEIRALARLARPRVGVITTIQPVHLENFDSIEGIAAAKRELAEELPDGGVLVLSADDPRTAAMAAQFRDRLRVITFGLRQGDVHAVDARRDNGGWQLSLALPGESPVETTLHLPGEHSLANFLAAAAVAHAMGVEAAEIARLAPGLALPSMRGQVHHAGGVTVLDDSYNASPTAMMRALETLAGLPGDGRLILAAGDMLELGAWAEEAHREVGLHAAQLGFDLVVTVGVLARDLAMGARAGGLDADAVRSFSSPEEAAEALCAEVRPGDRVLVKGSRAMRMERVAKALLAAAEEAD